MSKSTQGTQKEKKNKNKNKKKYVKGRELSLRILPRRNPLVNGPAWVQARCVLPYNKLNYLAIAPKGELSMQKISNMYGCSLEVNLHIRTS